MTVSSQAGSGSRPAMSSGSVMLSAAASTGSRLNAWNTKPTRSRRSRVSRRSGIPLICSAPIHTLPLVAESRPAMQCISVDLPEPDGPITEVKDPAGISADTPASAVTAASPLPYVLVSFSVRAARAVTAGAGVGAICRSSHRRYRLRGT